MERVLVIDDSERAKLRLLPILSREGFDVLIAADRSGALRMLGDVDLIFASFPLTTRLWPELLEEIRARGPTTPVIMILEKKDRERENRALILGAFDCLVEPLRKGELLRAARTALSQKRLLDEKLKAERDREICRTNLTSLLGSLSDAVIAVDDNMYITDVNRAVEQICGMNPGEIVGKHFDTIRNDCLFNCRNALRESMAKNRDIRDFKIRCGHVNRPGQTVLVRSSATMLGDEHQHSGGFLVLKDVSRLNELEEQLQERHRYHNIVCKSKAMQRVSRQMEDLADTDTTVLITGEGGTGKRLLGQTLHYLGSRAFKPLIVVDCSAYPETMLESELFGCVKGAFQGSIRDKRGRLKIAEGGTVILDAIGAASPMIQVRLARLLRDKEYERAGESVTQKADVRVIATSEDLERKCAVGDFRGELYSLLSAARISLPPLRERIDDIPSLIEYFRNRFNTRFEKHIGSVSREVLDAFLRYPWPGNVRELEDAVEHAFLLCRNDRVELQHLPGGFLMAAHDDLVPFKKRMEASREAVIDALEKTGWRRGKAAQLLGMSRQNLHRLMTKHQLRRK
jgi:PAS domain S-box-containing protein